MATKKKEDHKEEKPARKHLHGMRIEVAKDGSHAHYETYKKHKDDHETEPERLSTVTRTPEEAGQHVEDRLAMNQQGGEGDQGAAPEGGAGDGGAPAGGGGAGEPDEPGAADGEEM